jgi:hypothetical protein
MYARNGRAKGSLDHLERAFVGGRGISAVQVGQVAWRELNVKCLVAFLNMVRA